MQEHVDEYQPHHDPREDVGRKGTARCTLPVRKGVCVEGRGR